MEDQDLNTTSEAKMEPVEVSETPSPDNEFDELEFVPKEITKDEVIKVGSKTVVFREPTKEELPTEAVSRADTGFIGKDYFSDAGEWAATTVGKSPTGNEIQVTKRADGLGYVLGWRNGGTIPGDYAGWYTTFEKAEGTARIFLAKLWDEARDNHKVA